MFRIDNSIGACRNEFVVHKRHYSGLRIDARTVAQVLRTIVYFPLPLGRGYGRFHFQGFLQAVSVAMLVALHSIIFPHSSSHDIPWCSMVPFPLKLLIR